MSAILWLASYPKSGNTWLRAFLHNVLVPGEGQFDINLLGGISDSDASVSNFAQVDTRAPESWTQAEIMAMRTAVQKRIAESRQGTELCKTHNAMMMHLGKPLISMAATAGSIYVVRNPLDVVISNANHLGGSIDQTIEVLDTPDFVTHPVPGSPVVSDVMGSRSQHVASWTGRPNRGQNVMRYEDMLADPGAAFGDLVAFMGLNLDASAFASALENCWFVALQRQETEKGFGEATSHSRFFRKGTAGQWCEVLTPDQIAAVVGAHREQMARFNYVPDGF